jgi:hypothetical protein
VSGILSVYLGSVVRLELLVRVNTTALAEAARAGATSLSVYDLTGYTAADSIVIEPSPTPELSPQEILVISAATGHTITCAATAFAHPKGTLVSRLIAATVTAQVELPDGTIVAGSVASVSTGRYRLDYTTAYVGTHVVEWAIAGTALGAGAYTFAVSDDLV